VGRFLVVVPPLEGHTNPTVALAAELTGRGHDVAWTGHPEVVPGVLPPAAEFLPVADHAPAAVVEATAARNLAPARGALGFRAFWEEFVLPTAHHMVPGVEAAVDAWAPDVMLVDQHALAGVAVALRRGLPWVTSATTSADLVDPLAGIPKVAGWLRARMTEVLTGAGVDPAVAAAVDPRFSPHLLVAFTSRELVGPPSDLPEHWALVGPALSGRHDPTPFPWERLGGTEPVVLVTLGTVNWRAGARFLAVAAEALDGMPVQAVIVAPDGLAPDPPAGVLVVPRVPQLALLERTDLVVCHGGHNTVCESLAAGVPLVLAPVRDDQPFVAEQVVRAGAGERVRFGRITVPELHQAVSTVLGDPAYRTAAARVGASFVAAGGAAAAADRLDVLLATEGVAGRREMTTQHRRGP
jgi:MGT family glycosyltransferase